MFYSISYIYQDAGCQKWCFSAKVVVAGVCLELGPSLSSSCLVGGSQRKWKMEMEMEKWNVCVQGETGLYRRTLGNPAANSLTCLTPYRPDLCCAHTFHFSISISISIFHSCIITPGIPIYCIQCKVKTAKDPPRRMAVTFQFLFGPKGKDKLR